MTTASYGQSFGIKGGVNYVNLVETSSGPSYGDYILAFHAGMFSTVEITEKFSLRPEILYSKKGYDRALSSSTIDIQIQRRLHYLNLPVLMQFRPLKQLAFLAGPEFGYILAARQDINSPNFTKEINDMYDRFDLGLAAGINFLITENLQSEIRYTHGLSDLANNSSILGSNLQNRTFQFSVGYILR